MQSRSDVFQTEVYTATTPTVDFQQPTSHTLTDVWAAVTCAFERAVQLSTPNLDYFYQLDGHVIRLHFASQALVDQLTPALTHLATTPHVKPALTIKLWESTTTGVFLPPLPALLHQPEPDHRAWGCYAHSERFRSFFQPSFQMFTMLDSQCNEAICWVHDAGQLPLADGGAPLLTLLHWWLGQRGYQVVHGAAVGTSAGAVLLVGKSGSGKSTTALACLNAGLAYLGDDYCLVGHVQGATPRPITYTLYSSGKVHFADLMRFPRLQTAQSSNRYADADKALYFFATDFTAQIWPNLPLKAILLPQIKPAGESSINAVSPATALLQVAPSTVFQLIGEKEQILRQLGELVRKLPCYRLELGPDLVQIPTLIADLLAKL
ncbi:MAG: hypothetical protein U0175_20150 [Caldilineaceae bacterium]